MQSIPANESVSQPVRDTALSHVNRISSPPSLPSMLLTNANRVLNKLDELYVLVSKFKIDIICITESWLDANTPDSVI